MAAWGLPDGSRSLAEVRQRSYCNQLALWWEMSFEIGAVSEEWVRLAARELFAGDVSRRWWKDVRPHRYAYASDRKLEVLDLLNGECERADAAAETTAPHALIGRQSASRCAIKVAIAAIAVAIAVAVRRSIVPASRRNKG
jgi:hypothetical protein